MDTTLTISAYRSFDTPNLAKLSLNLNGRPVVKIGNTSYEIRLTGKPKLELPQWKTIAEQLDGMLSDKGILAAGTERNKNQLDGLRVHNDGIVFNGATTRHTEGTDTTHRWTQITTVARTPAAGAAGAAGAGAVDPAAPPTAMVGSNAAQAAAQVVALQLGSDARYMEEGQLAQWTTLINDMVHDDQVAHVKALLPAGNGTTDPQIKAYLRQEAVKVGQQYLNQTIDTTIRARENWQEAHTEELSTALVDVVRNALIATFTPYTDDAAAEGAVVITDAETKTSVRALLTPEAIGTAAQTRLQALQEEETRRPAATATSWSSVVNNIHQTAEQAISCGRAACNGFNQMRDYFGF